MRKQTGFFRTARPSNVIKLLPMVSFLLASFQFLLPLPALGAVTVSSDSTPSMNSNGYFIQSVKSKNNLNVTSPAGVLAPVSYVPLLFSWANHTWAAHLSPNHPPVSYGIRAPPFVFFSNH